MLRVAKCQDLDLVRALDAKLFPHDKPVVLEGAAWWIARLDGEPVGYAGAGLDERGNCYLLRCGVLESARGRGLQRRFIQARLVWGLEQGADYAYTYTLVDRVHSGNNLARSGFRLYRPDSLFVGDDVNYWKKDLE